MANIEWSDGAPIYRQLKERVIAMMLDGVLKPGDALPSVRQVAADYQLNPITVSRAYQELADEALVEKRRGLGMFVTEEASKKLRSSERERFLANTKLGPKQRVREMSKGMIVQLHLALVMAIDAKLLVLDEPTLGLDILYRKQFYQRLLEDYFDEQKTIIVTTHQVEEIEHILTDVLFIQNGKIVLDAPMDDVGERFVEVLVNAEQLEAARAHRPIDERALPFGKTVMLFDNVPVTTLSAFGETRTPGLADLFVATMKGAYA